MFKKTISITIAVLVLMQSLVNLGLYGYYTLNKKMITEKLCINRNRPEMHCNGHCYLAKQLTKAEQNEKQQSQVLKEKDEVVNINDYYTIVCCAPVLNISKIHITDTSLILPRHTPGMVKPPAA